MKFIITKANSDADGRIINSLLTSFAKNSDNVHLYDSLGAIRYLSCLKYATMVIGNSSSGLVEAPSFGIPTVNIGDRQKGRLKPDSVIDCDAEEELIIQAINRSLAISKDGSLDNLVNPYGDGNTSDRIVQVLIEQFSKDCFNLKKSFYNVKIEEV